MKTLKIFRK